MIYEISASIRESDSSEVEADNEEEAKAKALAIGEEILKKLVTADIDTWVHLSDKNFCFAVGAIYLVSYYSKFIPAECLWSQRCWGAKKFEHEFKYLGSQRRVHLYGEKPRRVIKMLCEDGKINKPECKNCIAKFNCYTLRNK